MTNKENLIFLLLLLLITGGLAFSDVGGHHSDSSIVDNANGTASGFSAASSASDLLATAESAEYITSN